MVRIFVSYAAEDIQCVGHICQDLETTGYTVQREPTLLDHSSILYSKTTENIIVGSAAVVLLWSAKAAQSEWVERHILFAQGLKKLLLPVVIDGTSLPNTLIVYSIITSLAPCTDVVAQLVSYLPSPESTDSLIKLSEQAAHKFIRVRKEAIDLAAAMLRLGENREAVLAVLEYLARNDLMMGVRDKAREVLDADAKKGTPLPFRPDESRHIFGVRCKNGHITYFDKRHVCPKIGEAGIIVRSTKQRADRELDELYLTCQTCGVGIVVHIDCEGYEGYGNYSSIRR